MNLLSMTLSGGLFVLFIVVVRALALHHLPKGAFLALWEMAALRLLLPFTLPLPFGLPAPAGRLAAGVSLRAPVAASGAPDLPGAAPGTALLTAWLMGAALIAAYFAVSYWRARRRFAVSVLDATPAVRCWVAGQALRRPLQVRQSPLVESPLTYGALRPVILLPAGLKQEETGLIHILTHELVHIRRFDSVAKLLFAAVLCVHWFNPLAWVLYILANRDLELSCDERVMDILGGREKAAYALTLIDMEESRCFSPYNHFSKLAIEERIEAIMTYKKASVLTVALATILVTGATTAFAASAAAQEQQDYQIHTSYKESTVLSYVNPEDGKIYYSFDNGETFQPLTEEEFQQRSPVIEWWTYEEYAAWLEEEKGNLQSMLGETGSTGGRGEFVWTQEIIDETIAQYEGILEEIKAGQLYSKTVDGEDSIMISVAPANSTEVDE